MDGGGAGWSSFTSTGVLRAAEVVRHLHADMTAQQGCRRLGGAAHHLAGNCGKVGGCWGHMKGVMEEVVWMDQEAELLYLISTPPIRPDHSVLTRV